MFFLLTTLDTDAGAAWAITQDIEASTSYDRHSFGHLHGSWISEIGRLNRIVLLHSFNSEPELGAARDRILESKDPFSCGNRLINLSMENFRMFPSLPAIDDGAHGPIYELRTYSVKPGRLSDLIDAWEEALPQRTPLSKLVVAMFALSGPLRIVHLWAYPSMENRFSVRAAAVSQDIWPPKRRDQVRFEMESAILIPTGRSPLQ